MKEVVNKEVLLSVLDLLDSLKMRYWVDGGWYEFKREWFTTATFENRIVPCISAEAQKLFHTGYELREVDKIDMRSLSEYFMIPE